MARFSREDIEWLIEVAAREDLDELEVTEGDASALVKRREMAAPQALATVPLPAAEAPAGPAHGGLVPVLAPMSGVFYSSAAPDARPFADVGDEVQLGETVCLIEAMKLYNDVPAPCSGRIESFLVSDGDHVDADQELLLIRPVGD